VTDPAEDKLLSDVSEYGWHMLTIPADDHGPGFTYTVGLFHSYAHPEVIVFGLPNQVMQRVVDVVATLVKGGQQFKSGDQTDDVLNGYSCAFRTVLRAHYRDHLGYAMWYYRRKGHAEFPALQCLWPDKDHHFPWDSECDAGISALQPALYGSEK